MVTDRKVAVSLLVGAAMLCGAARASAQDDASSAPQPAPGPTPGSADEVQKAPDVAPPQATPLQEAQRDVAAPPAGNVKPPEPQPPEEEPDSDPIHVRPRVGFSIVGGPSLPIGSTGGNTGGFGGAYVRGGVQITHIWSAYYQAGGHVGAFILAAPNQTQTTVFVAAYNSLCGGATIGHTLDLAFCPSVDSIVALSTSVNNNAVESIETISGTSFGLHGHVAALLGGWVPTPFRRGFSISADLHPTFIAGRVLFTAAFGIGSEWY